MRCKICRKPEEDWEEGDLDDHLRAAHVDEPAAVRTVYSDRYERVFGDGAADLGGGAADGDPAGDGADTPDGLDNEFDDTYGKKWFVIGVGGAGNNIVDSILMRRETLRERNDPRARIWEGGLAGYGILNTNIAELEQTYYTQEVKGYSRTDLLSNAIIGQGVHNYQGMGRRWDHGKKVMEADFEDGNNPFQTRWDMSPQQLRDAQAIMFIHSVTKGTGCGATPVLAEKTRELLHDDDFVISKAFLSSVVLPQQNSPEMEYGGKATINGVVGLAQLSSAVNAIIPFDNGRLDSVEKDIRPDVDNIEQYIPGHYAHLNKPLIAFLEAFTMSSTPQFVEREATMSIHGDVFDVADSFRPVEDKYPLDRNAKHRPAVILAPILGRARGEQVSESMLETLASSAFYQNKLAKFNPQTAWGGTFLLYGPEEKMQKVSNFVSDGTFQSIIGNEDFLHTADKPGVESIDIHVEQLVTPALDDLYLWGTLWNPEMPSLNQMYEHAREIKEHAGSAQGQNLREIWDQVDPLFSCLGRENMA